MEGWGLLWSLTVLCLGGFLFLLADGSLERGATLLGAVLAGWGLWCGWRGQDRRANLWASAGLLLMLLGRNLQAWLLGQPLRLLPLLLAVWYLWSAWQPLRRR
ncbi:hypothetical protein Dcar01_00243 [Deinococcus carri]|uniref:Uncharacterized protein n=1 Tax=Deinococcus carri TaxID=1211323 RepID=A0ABP9W2E7_9DEIO